MAIDVKQFILQARQKGVPDDDIVKYLQEKKMINTTPVKPLKPLSQKGADLVDNTIGKAANFMFDATGKTVGSLIAGNILRTVGKEKQAEELEKNINPLNVGITALEMTPLGLGKKTAAKVIGKFSAPLIARAEKLYQTALKPASGILKKSPEILQTGLKEGIKVSEKGLQKVNTIIEDIGEDIAKVIDKGVAENKFVSKNKLLPYLGELKEYMGNSLGGKTLVKEVDDLSKQILGELPDNIPIKQAQIIKQNTQSLLKKFYGQLKGTEVETKKQLTRGLKEEIAKEVPEVAKLNARDKKLIDLGGALTNAVNRMGNREVINAFDILSASIGLVQPTGAVQKGLGILAIKKILQSPMLKSQRAIIYYKLADNGAKLLKAGRIPAAIATAKILELFSENQN